MKPMTPDELEAALRDIGARRYHRLHPFHALLHGGKCTKGQVQAWALNRYYYQAMIPVKDASLIARCDDSSLRREWRSRLVDHDGETEGDGGIARWLKLTDGARARPRLCRLARGPAPGDALCGRGLRPLRPRQDAARGRRLLAHRAVLAADHRRAGRRHAQELRFRQRRYAGLFLQAPAAGAARFRFRARLRQAPRQDARGSSEPCSRRSNSSATCCGRCSTRSTMPMWRPGMSRPARSYPKIRSRSERSG